MIIGVSYLAYTMLLTPCAWSVHAYSENLYLHHVHVVNKVFQIDRDRAQWCINFQKNSKYGATTMWTLGDVLKVANVAKNHVFKSVKMHGHNGCKFKIDTF